MTTWKTVFNKVVGGGGGHEYELVYFKQSNINILVPRTIRIGKEYLYGLHFTGLTLIVYTDG